MIIACFRDYGMLNCRHHAHRNDHYFFSCQRAWAKIDFASFGVPA